MASEINFQQDRGKLIEATLYVSELSVDDANFGITKLAKLLYYADCDSYVQRGAPLTGTTYLHFPHGPYPQNWYQVRECMERNGDVTVVYDTATSGYQKYRLSPRRAANLECLSLADKEILEAQVQRFAGFNAAGIEEYSRQELGWLSTEDGQPISYELAGIAAPPLSPRKIDAIREVRKRGP